MKVNSIQQQNFRGGIGEKLAQKLANNPKLVGSIAGLAGCSVVAQKLVMSAGEATVGPVIDLGVGKAITKITNEKDGRTNQSSKIQAVRTFSQTVGGTMTGIVIRLACIGAATAACIWAGKKAGEGFGGKVADILTQADKGKVSTEDLYKYHEKMAAWGKNIGGAMATCVMMVTNFIFDVPLINAINKKVSSLVGIGNKNNSIKEGE